MEKVNSLVCTLCKSSGHSLSYCPELVESLKEGFYSGSGTSSHDHDDEKLIFKTNINL